ncbi:MAG TPA: 23S rRNA (pseudouridine(1915)-N(3))-methyltransferase RlmH [Clostridiales bacterium]|nr:23S rRNA (pseudouridine(1915)-N(3))-methyltransferase RlmH [Clostridiales bacterium]HQP70589.1 23S rRNA (pseudouridine(1915)-N(3))-methyltransferase RlmH [Clostridiales bacterium]
MKILFLGVGKTKHKYLIEGIERYKKLLSPYADIEEKYIKEEAEKPSAVIDESDKLIKNIPAGYYTVLLDIKGKRLSSEDFSVVLNDLRDRSTAGIAFLIGGSEGVSDDVRKRSDLRLSFSDMTMTHQMIRLFLAEQIYRGFSIMNNKKYHK